MTIANVFQSEIKLFFSLILMAVLFSCKKDSPLKKTPEQILVSKTWKADEVRVQMINGEYRYYLRGGSLNTFDYSSDSLKFSLDNTGIYYFKGSQYNFTWNFNDLSKMKMTLVIANGDSEIIYLENIALTETYFTYGQYVPSMPSYIATVRRVPN